MSQVAQYPNPYDLGDFSIMEFDSELRFDEYKEHPMWNYTKSPTLVPLDFQQSPLLDSPISAPESLLSLDQEMRDMPDSSSLLDYQFSHLNTCSPPPPPTGISPAIPLCVLGPNVASDIPSYHQGLDDPGFVFPSLLPSDPSFNDALVSTWPSSYAGPEIPAQSWNTSLPSMIAASVPYPNVSSTANLYNPPSIVPTALNLFAEPTFRDSFAPTEAYEDTPNTKGKRTRAKSVALNNVGLDQLEDPANSKRRKSMGMLFVEPGVRDRARSAAAANWKGPHSRSKSIVSSTDDNEEYEVFADEGFDFDFNQGQENSRRKLFLERNRIAAVKSRAKKKEKVKDLERTSKDLCSKNTQLQADIRCLISEMDTLWEQVELIKSRTVDDDENSKTFVNQLSKVRMSMDLLKETDRALLDRDFTRVPRMGCAVDCYQSDGSCI